MTGVTVAPKTNNIKIGETRQLNVKIEPENIEYGAIAYVSSDEDVAEVDSSGLVTANDVGTVTITVDVDGVTDTATVNVTEPESGEDD